MQAPTKQGSRERQDRQQNSLHLALAKLQDQELTREQVRRVAVERSGVLHIEVHEAGSQRFFVYEASELQELWPHIDSRITLAFHLADDECAA